MKHRELATRVATLVGGVDNVVSLGTCATRLRFVLKDPGKARLKELSATEGVIQALQSGTQTQVVIGTHVEDVRDALLGLPGWDKVDGAPSTSAPQGRPIDRLFDFMAGTFQPLLFPLVGAAMVKLILAVADMLNLYDPMQPTPEVAVLTAASNALFYFMPIFVAMTASRKLGANPFLGGAIAAALMEPSFVALGQAGDVVKFFGAPMYLYSYANAVVPGMLVAASLALLERILKKFIPKILELILVPTLCLLILVPFAALVIGPLGTLAGEAMVDAVTWLSATAPFLFYLVIGVGWVFIVMLGLHWALIPLAIAGLATTGETALLAAAFAYQASMIGVGLGVILKSRKDPETRKIATAAFAASAIGGITEPTLYGLVLKNKRILAAELIGATAGALVLGAFGVVANALVIAPVLGIPVFSPVFGYILGMVAGIAAATAAILWLGYRDPAAAEADPGAAAAEGFDEGPTTIVLSPLAGRIVNLDEVPDPIFSGGLLGQGIAIEPTGSQVVSPVSGKVIVASESGHAVGIRTADGVEILIHLGLDTVQMKGEGFTVHVTNGPEDRGPRVMALRPAHRRLPGRPL